MDLSLLIPVGAGIIKNLVGWIPNALKDGTISNYEWSQLFETTLTVALIGFATMFGFGLDAVSASSVAVLATYGLSAIKKIGKK